MAVPGSINELLIGAANAGAGDYEIERSLRFNKDDSAYLSRDFPDAGSRTTFTISAWFKRVDLPSSQYIFVGGSGTNSYLMLDGNQLRLLLDGGATGQLKTNAVYRDVSAWMHVVVVGDSTNATSSDRLRMYVNGERITSFATEVQPAQDANLGDFNTASVHYFNRLTTGNYGNIYLADCIFLDGTAATAGDFGEFDANGVWQPIEVDASLIRGSITEGTGALSLYNLGNTFASKASPATFRTDPYASNLQTAVAGDSSNEVSYLIRGSGSALTLTNTSVTFNQTGRYYSDAYLIQTAGAACEVAETSGNKPGTSDFCVEFWINPTTTPANSGLFSYGDYNTDGSFGIMTTGSNSLRVDMHDGVTSGSRLTVVGGLQANEWQHFALTRAGTTCTLYRNGTSQGTWTIDAAADFTPALNPRYVIGNRLGLPFGSYNITSYFQDFRVYVGTEKYSGNFTLSTQTGANGFHLPFSDNSSAAALGTDTSGNENDWTVNNISVDQASLNVNPYSPTVTSALYGGTEAAVLNSTNLNDYAQIATPNYGTYFWQLELGTSIPIASSVKINMEAAGGTLGNFVVRLNDNSSTDTNLPVTGGRQTVTLNLDTETSLTKFRLFSPSGSGFGTYLYYILVDDIVVTQGIFTSPDNDSLIDSPTNGTQTDTGAGGEVVGNYATWNPLILPGGTLSDGNLKFVGTNATDQLENTIAVSSGKWYAEFTLNTGATQDAFGVITEPAFRNAVQAGNYAFQDANTVAYYIGGRIYRAGTYVSVATATAGDVIGIALDKDSNTCEIFKNGSSLGSETLPNTLDPIVFFVGNGGGNSNNYANFGQRPFAYSAPSGFKALCTANLDDPTIADGSTAFDAKLWSGQTSVSTDITGYNFAPDFVWIKNRNNTEFQIAFDIIRGAAQYIYPSEVNAESDGGSNTLTAFNSDGFTLYDPGGWQVNMTGKTYVGWAWDAGNSNTSIIAGSLNSSFYDQSQTWSDDMSTSNGWNTGRDGTKAFDSNTTLIPGASDIWAQTDTTGGTVTWTPNGYTVDTADVIYIKAISSTDRLTVVGSSSTQSNIAPGTVDGVTNVYTVPTTLGTVTSLSVTNPTGLAGFSGIKVGGKVLVDTGLTPAVSFPAIASTVRANPSAGFSIVSYTGNGTAGATVGHGLNAAPNFLTVKRLESTGGWRVYQSAIGATEFLRLDTNAAAVTSTAYWNDTEPTSSVFSIGNDSDVNATSATFIAYCFAPVEGYSAFGSYTGDGLADGPFVYTGFRPSWLMIKISTGTSSNWVLLDKTRDPYNVVENNLYADTNDAENQFDWVDFLSNGFKIRSALNQVNGSTYTYIYAAFAENPFKTARAR